MRLPDTPSYNATKNSIVQKYPALLEAINKLENKILENPEGGIKEVIFVGNRDVKSRRRGIRTSLFNNRLPDNYLYITINYGLTSEGDVLFLTIHLREYVV